MSGSLHKYCLSAANGLKEDEARKILGGVIFDATRNAAVHITALNAANLTTEDDSVTGPLEIRIDNSLELIASIPRMSGAYDTLNGLYSLAKKGNMGWESQKAISEIVGGKFE